ncbi:uncharacterized protein LOC108914106 [Anoplophora glabripennis]|uniref:uncharacterized protein LOC108914106 n=1 Tax=Anoplophora glabripennis TaxID=217634 RepID=UPI0008754A61|nr:uncharacterized protein LOC108914106 [Anoplophora glabripennis]
MDLPDFNEYLSNCNHGKNIHIEEPEYCVTNPVTAVQPVIHPEYFIMDGDEREGTTIKTRKANKQKLAKSLRNQGLEYISYSTKKTIPARKLKERCVSETCKLYGKNCYEIDEEMRQNIFELFCGIRDLHSQREFLIRHIEKRKPKKTRVSDTTKSRRQQTLIYKLTANNKDVVVCKKLFLNTLGVTEKMCRTALSKVTEVGLLEKDLRGGRQRNEETKNREKLINIAIHEHIDRFPKVESHYRRAKTNRMYLHPDLSLQKMYAMYLEDLAAKENTVLKASFSLYRKIFKQKKLSFCCPKKIASQQL